MANKLRIKKSLRDFSSYSADKTDYRYRLNANELPFEYKEIFKLGSLEEKILKKNKITDLNRYPDSFQGELKSNILKFYKLKKGQILFGNGSDELILYILLTLTGKTSKVLYLDPSFSMYRILTKALGLRGVSVPLRSNFNLNLSKVLRAIKLHDPDVIFIASPNNPSGNSFDKNELLEVVKYSKGIVVIDEAYSQYSNYSCVNFLKDNKNLLIMKTMSKIGFASLRLGFLLGDKSVIDSINKLRLPYNISTFSQIIANKFYMNPSVIDNHIQTIKNQRVMIIDFLKNFSDVKVFRSDSNFVLIKLKKSLSLYNFLRSNDLIVKNFPNEKKLSNCLRITIGKPVENNRLMSLISEFFKK